MKHMILIYFNNNGRLKGVLLSLHTCTPPGHIWFWWRGVVHPPISKGGGGGGGGALC